VTDRPILFGEVLFDHFPDGSAVLGGAPFNVAWHLRGFGLDPLLISRIGSDDEGRHVLDAMTGWGLDRAGIQIDANHPTGAVNITLEAGQPSFDIVANAAYDHIAADQIPAGVDGGLLYHGSLAARGGQSRAALMGLRSDDRAVFVDINLRPPWWDRDRVAGLIRGARWLKLNEDELLQIDATAGDPTVGAPIAGRMDDSSAPTGAIATLPVAEAVKTRFGLHTVIITRGSKGAFILDPDGVVSGEVPAVELVDAVGAGDAFSSVMILGFARGWSAGDTLERALNFAAAICRVRGAVSGERDLYRHFLSEWGA